MLTIGAKQLKHFAALHDRLTLFARILPAVASLQQALQAGFTPTHILCLRPPFSREFNRSILREYAIDVLVTKAGDGELSCHGAAMEIAQAKPLPSSD